MKLENIISEAISKKASDIHLTKGLKPMIRVDGVLQPIEGEMFFECDDEILENYVKLMLDEKEYEEFKEEKNADLSKSFKDKRLRIHIYKQMGVSAFSIRIIPAEIPELKSLNLPKSLLKLTTMKEGLVIVTGITGSGKSTTLAALINEINKNQSKHIITVEDPIEYVHQHKQSMINQREVGSDVKTFDDAVKAAMREDPDILLLGEMRDLDTIKNAITMAETGHLVFGTLHTKSVAETADRIIDVFPGDEQDQIRVQFSNSIRAIISQELLPRKGGGRIASCEVMFANNAIRNLIKNPGAISGINDMINSTSKTLGSQTKLQSLAALYKGGLITIETAINDLDDSQVKTLERLIGKNIRSNKEVK